MFSFNQFDSDKNTFIFSYAQSISVRTVLFVKPLGIKFVQIFAVGGGGGGGAGTSWITSTTRNGGGGGGGAAVTVGLFPANLLPDALYVSVGAGGSGGSSGSIATPGTGDNGGAGKNSTIYLVHQPSISSSGGILLTARGGEGGTGGSILSVGDGGTAAVAATISDMPAASIGTFTATAGTVGGSASAGAGLPSNPYETSFVSGGGGGGRLSSSQGSTSGGSSGFNINDIINTPGILGGTSTNNGQNGLFLFKPYFVSLGGGGGGSGSGATPGNAGNGGIGGTGSGGGGGGGAYKTSSGNDWNGGLGGDGGDGIVIITCW